VHSRTRAQLSCVANGCRAGSSDPAWAGPKPSPYNHIPASLLALAGVFLATMTVAAVVAQPSRGPTIEASAHPGPEDVARALDIVRADPNLATERTIATLRWDKQKAASVRPAWVVWIFGLFGWLARSARIAVWAVLLVLAAVLIAYIVRIVRKRGVPTREAALIAPTHVRDLDIRPETLPHDIGAAARTLWDRGEHRAALALLYRGVLSRLAHVHHLPIRDSTTEGDCLVLATRHLAPAGRNYASRVIVVWQRAVYGHAEVQPSIVHRLCDDFAAALAATPLAETGGAEGAV
jgi:hypothetical protein